MCQMLRCQEREEMARTIAGTGAAARRRRPPPPAPLLLRSAPRLASRLPPEAPQSPVVPAQLRACPAVAAASAASDCCRRAGGQVRRPRARGGTQACGVGVLLANKERPDASQAVLWRSLARMERKLAGRRSLKRLVGRTFSERGERGAEQGRRRGPPTGGSGRRRRVAACPYAPQQPPAHLAVQPCLFQHVRQPPMGTGGRRRRTAALTWPRGLVVVGGSRMAVQAAVPFVQHASCLPIDF